MNGLSVIIPSKNAANLVPCVEAVRDAGESCSIIVVSDFEDHREAREALANSRGGAGCLGKVATLIAGIKPFVFSRNVNLGIQAAGSDDVVLLNDDALLESKDGLSMLQHVADRHPEIGIIGCTTNVTGAQCQQRQNIGLRIVENFAFVAVLIPRWTIERVGLLDERFGGERGGRAVYGSDDCDYIHRVKLAGLKVAVHDFCFVDHGSLNSTFRPGNGAGDCAAGREIYQEKWGTCEV